MLIDIRTQETLKKKFEQELHKPVDIKVFTRNIILRNENPKYARFSEDLVKELSQLSDKIKGEFLSLESEEAKGLNLTISPTILIGKDLGYFIEYWGAPAGQEASVFIETLFLLSRGESGLSPSSTEKLKNIDRNILLETYITLNCPYCPRAVLLSNQMAVEMPGRITSRYIEAEEVMARAQQFRVSSVPQQVINEDLNSISIGVQPEEKLVKQIISYGSSRAEEVFAREREELKKKELLADNPDYPVVLNSNNFDQAVNKYLFLIVDCWAEWCMPCQMVHPVIASLAKKHKGKITFGKLNIDENKEIASRFGIRSIPTLLVFKNSEKVDIIVGALPEEQLDRKISSYGNY